MYLSALSTASHSGEPEPGKDSSTIVAVDRDKNSQQAAKWAVDRLMARGSTLQLVHVRINQSSQTAEAVRAVDADAEMSQLFISYRGYCARKGVSVH